MLPPLVEKRNTPMFVTYSPAITRIEQKVEEWLFNHDVECSRISDPDWQGDYSLLAHCTQLGTVIRAMARDRKLSHDDLILGYVSALFHDAGKADPLCHPYRYIRPITSEERAAINEHARISGELVERFKVLVRKEDYVFLDKVALIVRYHHKPYLISDPQLREIAYYLKYGDAFLAKMENRHKAGLSQFKALEWLEKEFAPPEINDPLQQEFKPLILGAIAILKGHYGLENLYRTDYPDT